MIFLIVKREIQYNLISLRFVLSLLLVLALMVTNGVIFSNRYKTVLEDYSTEVNDVQHQLREAGSPKGIAGEEGQKDWNIYKHPNPLIFCAEGGERELPNLVKISVNRVGDSEIRARRNFILPSFADIDWVYIVAVVLSFVAVLFTFDAISGEKEARTLALVFSNSIPRHTLLLGKYLGAFVTLLFPLSIGMLLNLLILSISGTPLAGDAWLKVGTIAMISLLYVSAFVLLGLFVSCFSSNSPTSLLLLLLIWVSFVLGIPAACPMLSKKLYEVPTAAEMQRQVDSATQEVLNQHVEKFTRGNLPPNSELADPIKFNVIIRQKALEAALKFRNEWLNKWLAQANQARDIARLSPTTSYRLASEVLAGTGQKRHEHFMKQAKNYQETLAQFVKAEDLKEKSTPHFHKFLMGSYLSSKRADPSSIPIFKEKFMPFSEALKDALLDVGLLMVFNIAFFMGAYVSLLKSSIK